MAPAQVAAQECTIRNGKDAYHCKCVSASRMRSSGGTGESRSRVLFATWRSAIVARKESVRCYVAGKKGSWSLAGQIDSWVCSTGCWREGDVSSWTVPRGVRDDNSPEMGQIASSRFWPSVVEPHAA